MADVAILKSSAASFASNDPWARSKRQAGEAGLEQHGITLPAQTLEVPTPSRPRQFPLRMLGPLGCIAFKDKTMFDSRLMLDASYKYNGIKGGMAWKCKVDRYFVTQAPCLRELLAWA